MTIKTTLIILSLMGWFGETMHTPICSDDDLRVQRGSMSYDEIIERYGRDELCDE